MWKARTGLVLCALCSVARAACVGGAPDEGESAGIEQRDCHRRQVAGVIGAFFRKVSAAPQPAYGGIRGEGVLPLIAPDPGRWWSTSEPDRLYQNGPMDRPSIYMGGRAGGTEVDAGLTWDRVYHTDARATWTDDPLGTDGGHPERRFVRNTDGTVVNVAGQLRPEGLEGLLENFAFRPFWRAMGQWHNPDTHSPDNVYWYPGEAFRMSVRQAGRDLLKLFVASDDRLFWVGFGATGWGRGLPQSFKRVNSIDQFTVEDGRRVGLETLHSEVLATNARATGAVWTLVSLLDTNGNLEGPLGCAYPAVMGSDAVFADRYDEVFAISGQNADGGEAIDIRPPGRERVED